MTDDKTIHSDEPVATQEVSPPESSADHANGHHEPVDHHMTSDSVSQSASDSQIHEATDSNRVIREVSGEHPISPDAGKPAKKSRKSKAAAQESAVAETPVVESHPPSEPVADESVAAVEGAAAAVQPAATESNKKWYVVKIQSGREDSIKAAIERKVKIEGLEEFFGQIAIPVEELVQKKTVKVTDKKTGEKLTQEKKVIKYLKKFPGYLFAEVEFNDRILYLFRETSGVGDFVGASLKRDPTPMTDREVRAMLTGVVDGDPNKPNQKQKVKLDYEKGDKVKIRDGAFANMEGIVKSITETKDTGETPKVKVEVTIFGRPVEVDLDYWHVDKS